MSGSFRKYTKWPLHSLDGKKHFSFFSREHNVLFSRVSERDKSILSLLSDYVQIIIQIYVAKNTQYHLVEYEL